MSLSELAERCEHARGPDYHLDLAIWLALCGPADRQSYEEGLSISSEEARFRADYMSGGLSPTSSLDAAMTLVPERHVLSLNMSSDDEKRRWEACGVAQPNWTAMLIRQEYCGPKIDFRGHCRHGEAATPALALCAAALKARAALAGEAGTAETPQSGSVHEHATAKPERPNTGPHNV